MVNALFDTNILIDYLNGVPAAQPELERFSDKAISVITWMEVMVGANPETEDQLRAWLGTFLLVPIDERVCDVAVALRKRYRIKLPDAIVWATAQAHRRILVTRNFKDFPENEPGVRIPYRV